MKPTLSATHLLRQFVLFALTTLLLLTVIRLAYGLWQFPKIAEADALLPLFVQGLRFDLALIGLICIIPVVLGSLLSVVSFTRPLAKFLIVFFLMLGLFFVLTLELLTPWFIDGQGVRPDINMIGDVQTFMNTVKSVFVQYAIPIIIGISVSALILIAFWVRMEVSRFLRYTIFAPTGLLMALIGGLFCVLAIWSTPDLRKTAFSPADALISQDVTVNDLSMNTAYKTLYSIISPVLGSSSATQGKTTE